MPNTPLNKRFWKTVTTRPEADGFAVLLDERPLKTPLKQPLLAPTPTLADAIAAEWDAVEGEIDPRNMHLTRCANATIDNVAKDPHAVADMLAEYGATDLLCYRAQSPEGLVKRQAAAWDPVLDWLRDTHGITLEVTRGIMFVAQPAKGQEKLRARVRAFDPWQLTGFHDLVTISGSLVLALAVVDGFLTPGDAWDRSRVDENWQEDLWGVDDESAETAALKKADFTKAVRLLELLES